MAAGSAGARRGCGGEAAPRAVGAACSGLGPVTKRWKAAALRTGACCLPSPVTPDGGRRPPRGRAIFPLVAHKMVPVPERGVTAPSPPRRVGRGGFPRRVGENGPGGPPLPASGAGRDTRSGGGSLRAAPLRGRGGGGKASLDRRRQPAQPQRRAARPAVRLGREIGAGV